MNSVDIIKAGKRGAACGVRDAAKDRQRDGQTTQRSAAAVMLRHQFLLVRRPAETWPTGMRPEPAGH